MNTKETGFTLIELLVVIVIIGVLAAISVMNFSIYRQKVYDTRADALIHNAEVAIAAGRIKIDQDGDIGMNYNLWTNWDGSLQAWPSTQYFPGLALKGQERINANYSTWCDSAFTRQWCPGNQACCIVESVTAYHCKSKTVKSRMRWNNGLVENWTWENWGC